jgi:aldehyde dehydrogenase
MTIYARPGTEGSLMSFQPRYGNFIGGEWVAPAAGRYFENVTPVTGQPFCEIARSDEADIEKAGAGWQEPQHLLLGCLGGS